MTDDPWLFVMAAAPGALVALAIGGLTAAALARGNRRWAHVALATTVLILPANGLGGSLALSRAFDASAHAEPSRKAMILADGISGVMNGIALGMAAVLLAALIALGAVLWTPRVISEQEGA